MGRTARYQYVEFTIQQHPSCGRVASRLFLHHTRLMSNSSCSHPAVLGADRSDHLHNTQQTELEHAASVVTERETFWTGSPVQGSTVAELSKSTFQLQPKNSKRSRQELCCYPHHIACDDKMKRTQLVRLQVCNIHRELHQCRCINVVASMLSISTSLQTNLDLHYLLFGVLNVVSPFRPLLKYSSHPWIHVSVGKWRMPITQLSFQ